MKKRILSKKNFNKFLIEINKSIDETCETVVDNLMSNEFSIVYPPDGGYTEAEIIALKKIQDIPNIKNAMRKLLADSMSIPIFHLLSIIDGVGGDIDLSLLDKDIDIDQEGDFLHSEFFGAYRDWKNIRGNNGWTLDLYGGSLINQLK